MQIESIIFIFFLIGKNRCRIPPASNCQNRSIYIKYFRSPELTSMPTAGKTNLNSLNFYILYIVVYEPRLNTSYCIKLSILWIQRFIFSDTSIYLLISTGFPRCKKFIFLGCEKFLSHSGKPEFAKYL